MKTARQTAFEILSKINKDNAYSNLLLDSVLDKSELSQVDKAFVSALVYGVVERMITLDYEISLYLKQPIKKLKPQVLNILRMGAYQILFMDKIPSAAAINESVKLTKNNGVSFASGLVNAVLRKVDAAGITDTDNLSVRYSAPEWLVSLWSEAYGEEHTLKLLEAALGETVVTVRVNTLLTDADSLIRKLTDEGVCAENSAVLENVLNIKSSGPLHKTKSYSEGLFHVQDIASQLCCKALDVKENDVVIDVCSAPGGKSFTLSQYMNNTGNIYSCDIHEHRLKLIENSAKRLEITNITTFLNDGSVFNDKMPSADRILCDVPCAGLGVIRKKPEIRYKQPGEFDKLPELQYSILSVSAQYLKVGGVLVYSTCSLNPAENEEVINKFLNEHSNFESVRVLPDVKRYSEDTDYLTLMPHIHNCDGFFISAVRKIKEV